jgi:hypothetical protein
MRTESAPIKRKSETFSWFFVVNVCNLLARCKLPGSILRYSFPAGIHVITPIHVTGDPGIPDITFRPVPEEFDQHEYQSEYQSSLRKMLFFNVSMSGKGERKC